VQPRSPEAQALAASTVRALTVDAVRAAQSGHVGLPLGCAELGVLLYGEILRHDPSAPDWPDRDRFVLSAGHGSMFLYSLLHLSGYPLPLDEIRRFRQLGSRTPGHPEHALTPGVETTTGPLGQGIGNAVGMALAERLLSARFGSELCDHRTYALVSDGDLMEGAASEACSLAGHLGLGRLCVFYDDNRVTIDGPAGLAFSEDVGRRFEAYGWAVQYADGHDPDALRAAISRAQQSEERPHLIVCRTVIGRGSPVAGTAAAHGNISDEAVEQTRETLGWTLPPFEIPDGAREVFRANAERGAALRRAWEERRRRALWDPGAARQWRAFFERELPASLAERMPTFDRARPLATREASGRVLSALADVVPSLIGGSADLTGSNNTKLAQHGVIERGKFEGRNLHYGVREHGMASIASGMALHGGLRPYIGTFLVFSDYMRPAVRLAALMGLPVVYVFTHDSIFVGEDGPTHQPIEQLAALRAIPNLSLWRPADARETAAAWQAALARDDGPTVLALTRHAVPVLDVQSVEQSALRGGYVVHEPPQGAAELALVATGSELAPSLEAARALAERGRRARVVSVPCLDVFMAQDRRYRDETLPSALPRLVVEAGRAQGLAPLLRAGDAFHGMDDFGCSAPWKALARHFGFTAEAIRDRALGVLET
jgi:transketolase